MKQYSIKGVDHIETLARQMAQSGTHEDSQSIEQSLVALGLAEEIRESFNADLRFELDRIGWRAVEQPKMRAEYSRDLTLSDHHLVVELADRRALPVSIQLRGHRGHARDVASRSTVTTV